MKYWFLVIIACVYLSCKQDKIDDTTNTSNTDTNAEVHHHAEGDGHEGHNHAGGEGHHHEGTASTNTNNSSVNNNTASNNASTAAKAEGQSAASTSTAPSETKATARRVTNEGITRAIKDPCSLISTSFIEKEVGYQAKNVRVKEGSRIQGGGSRSCFFQWRYSNDPDAGFLVSIMRNPVPEEIIDWPMTYIRAKRLDGESDMGSDTSYPCKDIKGLGIEAVGCFDLGKFYFRNDNDDLFLIALNFPINESQKKEMVLKIGNEVLKNYYK